MCNAEYINTCMFIEYSLLLNMYLCNIDNYKIYIEQVGEKNMIHDHEEVILKWDMFSFIVILRCNKDADNLTSM